MVIAAYAFLTCGILFNLLFGYWFFAAAGAFSILTIWASVSGRRQLAKTALILSLAILVSSLIWYATTQF